MISLKQAEFGFPTQKDDRKLWKPSAIIQKVLFRFFWPFISWHYPFKRLAFVIFCSDVDQYQKQMPDITDRLSGGWVSVKSTEQCFGSVGSVSLSTGAFLYAPYSFLLISYKFWGEGGGNTHNTLWALVTPYDTPLQPIKITRWLLYGTPPVQVWFIRPCA